MGNIQVNFPIKIYETREDYYDDDVDKSILQGKTDKKGKIVFRKKLRPKQYYIRPNLKQKVMKIKAL